MKNIFPDNYKPYVIVAPPYTDKSAGVRALHLLCHCLNISGYKAYLLPYAAENQSGKSWAHPMLITPQLYEHPSGSIIIYPEVVRGNPLEAKNVVRWLLGYPGVCGGDLTFPDTEMLWAYSARIAKSVDINRVLSLPVVDSKVFYPPDEGTERKGTCYYAKKYTEIWGGKVFDLPEDSVKLEGTPDDIAKTLRSSAKCYVYEDSSVILEARLCGCPVEYMHNEKFKEVHAEEDWAFSYPEIVSRFWDQLDLFIKTTQVAFADHPTA